MFTFNATTDACVKCAKCVPGCTIYKIKGDEVYSPRGFIDLLGAYEKGTLKLDTQMKDVFESCFLCTHCVSVCPASLPTDELIEEVRIDIAKTFGLSWYKRLFFYLLKNRLAMNVVSWMGSLLLPLFFKSVHDGLMPRFPLPFLNSKRMIPQSHAKSFVSSHPQEILTKHKNGHTRKVAIFIGCLSNYNYVSVGESLLEILNVLGIDVFLAKNQQCCGAPAHFTGDKESVLTLIKRNVDYFEGILDEVEVVLVPEATCAAMILHDWKRIAKADAQLNARITKVVAKFAIASQWLHEHTDLQNILATKKKQNSIITYHDPCHARKVLHVFKEPRSLIASNYVLREMSDPNACCGFGGITMQTERYDYARRVGESKAIMIQNSGAHIVSAECNACRMQLNDAMAQANVNVTFAHPLELIAKALRED